RGAGAGRAGARARGRGTLAPEHAVRGRRSVSLRAGRGRADGPQARALAEHPRRAPQQAQAPPGALVMKVARPALLRTVSVHLVRESLWAFALTLGAFIIIYLIADFFDRFDGFLRHDAAGGAIVRYFVFKIPLVVTQATPLAVLTGGIVGLGLLARQHEFVALR